MLNSVAVILLAAKKDSYTKLQQALQELQIGGTRSQRL
jgi:hypothetical protein